jgi:hypothetical protein
MISASVTLPLCPALTFPSPIAPSSSTSGRKIVRKLMDDDLDDR